MCEAGNKGFGSALYTGNVRVTVSIQDPVQTSRGLAYSAEGQDWHALLTAVGGRGAGGMVEAKRKERGLIDAEIG